MLVLKNCDDDLLIFVKVKLLGLENKEVIENQYIVVFHSNVSTSERNANFSSS